jgi:hypothetical protein
MTTVQIDDRVGRLTVICRWVCCVLLAAPLLYWWTFGYRGDPYVLLALAFVSLIGGVVLFLNSVFCFGRYRGRRHFFASAFFLVASVGGLIAMFNALPRFGM